MSPGRAALRDTLLGIAVKDIDIATPLVPAEVIDRLKAAQKRPAIAGQRLFDQPRGVGAIAPAVESASAVVARVLRGRYA